MNALEIHEFSKTYRKKILAVDQLSLKVKRGSLFAFIGPNGAGKTTTINYIAGLIRPTRGQLYILGKQIKDNYQYKQKIGMVLEKPVYLDKLTGEEYLTFVGQMYNLDIETTKNRTIELLEFLQLSDKKNEWIKSYSAGMKKKISLASALIHDPDLLILDEPLEGIDIASSKLIKENLRLMIEKGKTIFLSSHQISLIEQLCDEIAIINNGKLLFNGTIESIRQRDKRYSNLEQFYIDLTKNHQTQQKISWFEN
ncbi:ATP-binding cassette domain-containing protein [candidate division KSB1 bacterium]|nr:ATP-binding cassette domain-containing protein [candidate division KSB1 bacterium]